MTGTESRAIDLDPAVLDGLRGKLGEAVVNQLVVLFFETVNQRCDTIAEALKNDDEASAGAALHSIRGSAQLVGALRLEKTAATWELRAKKGHSAGLGQAWSDVRAALDGVERELNASRAWRRATVPGDA